MCKKSKFPLVFNIFLAFFITLVVTIFVKAGEGALTPESFIIGMIQGFCLNMTLETIIDLPAMGNKFVRALGVKKMEDRKSTRLNSSHTVISYAVFCLKK